MMSILIKIDDVNNSVNITEYNLKSGYKYSYKTMTLLLDSPRVNYGLIDYLKNTMLLHPIDIICNDNIQNDIWEQLTEVIDYYKTTDSICYSGDNIYIMDCVMLVTETEYKLF